MNERLDSNYLSDENDDDSSLNENPQMKKFKNSCYIPGFSEHMKTESSNQSIYNNHSNKYY